MKKEYVKYDPKFTSEKLSKMDLNKIYEQKANFEDKLKNSEFPIMGTNGKWAKREFFESIVAAMDAEISKRTYTQKETETAQETDVPVTIEEIPIPTMENETATGTSNAGETNVNKKLPKKSPKTIAKPKKNNYIKTTNETEGRRPDGHKTTKTGDKTMMNEVLNKNEIAKIAPNAVKNILAAQKTNKTDTKKTYWGGWGKVRNGMNSAYNDYNKFQELENKWAELRNRLGKGPKGHFCWSLINKNRVGVKQEPNSTLRFIKNVKIRIAMANDVLNGKYTETQINEYMNGLSTAYKLKYGLV